MGRREFLKKSAIGTASVAAVSVLGKTVYDMMEENDEQTTKAKQRWHDFAVFFFVFRACIKN